MTTGRINQVTAEDGARAAVRGGQALDVSYCWVDNASVSWGTMRPRMGFAPVRITALRRRQDPFSE